MELFQNNITWRDFRKYEKSSFQIQIKNLKRKHFNAKTEHIFHKDNWAVISRHPQVWEKKAQRNKPLFLKPTYRSRF